MSTDAIPVAVHAPADDELDSLTTLRLPDLIRRGSATTTQAIGWGSGNAACALSAAALALDELESR